MATHISATPGILSAISARSCIRIAARDNAAHRIILRDRLQANISQDYAAIHRERVEWCEIRVLQHGRLWLQLE
jgi:hypothetical protein